MTIQMVAAGIAYATFPAWLYWEFTIWHRRRRDVLPAVRERRRKRAAAPQPVAEH